MQIVTGDVRSQPYLSRVRFGCRLPGAQQHLALHDATRPTFVAALRADHMHPADSQTRRTRPCPLDRCFLEGHLAGCSAEAGRSQRIGGLGLARRDVGQENS